MILIVENEEPCVVKGTSIVFVFRNQDLLCCQLDGVVPVRMGVWCLKQINLCFLSIFPISQSFVTFLRLCGDVSVCSPE